MKRSFLSRGWIFVLLFVLVVLAISSFSLAQADQIQLIDPPADQVVVKPRQGVSIDTILGRYNASLLGAVSETKLYFLQLPAGQTANQLLPTLNSDPDLYYAEPNYYADGSPDGDMIMFGARMAPTAGMIFFGARGDLSPTPPGGEDQWAWTKIGLSDAQKLSIGQGIIVAVLDTGLRADHPLLRASIAPGYDFVGMSNSIYDTGNNLDDDGDGEIDEDTGHGTHVAGIIVTEAPGVQVMPIRVLNSDGVGTYWEVAAGIRYAVDHGADIINMSMSAPRLTPSLSDALDYAAAHGVMVIAAAGGGDGPNYPASYPDPLAVLGIGATDRDDSVAWFSGGLLADTDIYAPGVDIYSAFPYGDYVLGSGTSMAAPMAAGEAALLMARYPDWSQAQIIQRIREKTDPVPGGMVGRIHLADAITTSLQVDYAPTDPQSPNDNNVKPHIRLVNNTPEDIPLSELTIRYWYTVDSDQGQTLSCDYSDIGCGNITGSFTYLPDGSPNKTAFSDNYLEVGFTSGADSLTGGSWFDMYLRVNKNDWSVYNETNDYSFAPNSVTVQWDRITMYRNGVLIWGNEPAGTAPPPTTVNTATPSSPEPTKTNEAVTNTPLPPATATVQPSPTLVPTLVPPTNVPPTLTPMPTQAPTLLPPTATGSGGSALKLQYMTPSTDTNAQGIAPYMQLFNIGASSIPLSEIKIRYWFTANGDQTHNYWCDYASVGCGNIASQFVQLPVSRPGADYYLEIGFTSGAGNLEPGANTGPIQQRFSKSDWSNYTQSDDHSFDPSKIQYADWTKITVYQNGILVWGTEP
ncbi:MAG: S8 family serine peptidase [Anaerolineae bacterium]|nr:S8 family serine peptidase [Anaerolineae bacterium]